MGANLPRIILILLALTACTQDPDPNNGKTNQASTGTGYADIQRYFTQGATAQCPGGYDVISSFTINNCTNVFPPSGYATCTIAYCGLRFSSNAQFVVTDFKFYNHT